MARTLRLKQLSEYLTIREAASVLGVSAATLRNWDRNGKLPATRHPLNRYRLYLRADLETLLAVTAQGGSNSATTAY